MSLQLPSKFLNDIQGRSTNIIPIIHLYLNDNEILYLSTNSTTLGGNSYLPLLINEPSLKESISIETRKYKVSNVSMNFTNYEYNGSRLSDIISGGSIMNKMAEIYWVSQSAESIEDCIRIYKGYVRKYNHDDNKCSIVIEDTSGKAFHKDLPQTFVDSSESVPEAYRNKPIPIVMGYVDKSPCVVESQKFIRIDDKPIYKIADEFSVPVLFNGQNNQLKLNSAFNERENPLYVGIDGTYLSVLEIPERDLGTLDQLSAEEASETSDEAIDYSFEDINVKQYRGFGASPLLALTSNPLVSSDIIQCKIYHAPNNVELLCKNSDFLNNMLSSSDLDVLFDGNSDTYIDIDTNTQTFSGASNGTLQETYAKLKIYTNISVSDAKEIGVKKIAINNHVLPNVRGTSGAQQLLYTYPVEPDGEWHGGESDNQWNPGVLIGDAYSLYSDENSSFGSQNDMPSSYDLRGLLGFENISTEQDTGWHTEYTYFHNGLVPDIKIDLSVNTLSDGTNLANSTICPSIWFYDLCGMGLKTNYETYALQQNEYIIGFRGHFALQQISETIDTFMNISMRLKRIDVCSIVDIENALSQKYFVNAFGRPSIIASRPAVNAVDIMYALLRDELNIDQSENYSDLENNTDYHDWGIGETPSTNSMYGFTINEKIDSKKVIEELASASAYIPRFDSNDNFKINTIKKIYTPEADHFIDKEDIIDYSYSRTDLSEIATSVELHYKYDYSGGKLSKTITKTLSDPQPVFDYYGLANDHSESTLVIDNHIGRYIREDYMAEAFANWILKYNMNQKLILDIKVSLNIGLKIEVGDIIIFNQMLSNIKPYGIRYDINAEVNGNYGDMLNGQQIFPNMMVISTDKKMDHIKIKCQMMHNLSSDIVESDFISGCTYEGIEGSLWTQPPEYNPQATIDNGDCSWYFQGIYYGCANPEDGDYDEAYLEDGTLASLSQAMDMQVPTFTQSGLPYIHDHQQCDNTEIIYPPHHYFTWGAIIPHDMPHPDNLDNQAEMQEPLDKMISITAINEGADGWYWFDIDQIIYDWTNWFDTLPSEPISTDYNPIMQLIDIKAIGFPSDTQLSANSLNTLQGEHYTEGLRKKIRFIPTMQWQQNAESIPVVNIKIPSVGDVKAWLEEHEGNKIEITLQFAYQSYTGEIINNFEHKLRVQIGGCVAKGDANGDGGWNVLDIVTLANCVLAQNCDLYEYNCAMDVNGDGGRNILDIVTLANCVLAQNCGDDGVLE